MSLIDQLNAKRQVKSIWDLGRFLLAFLMAFVGIFLLSTLILCLFGVSDKTPLQIRILSYIPFIPFACILDVIIYEVCQRFRKKCKSEWDFWMIMLSFSLAGMFIMPVRKFIFHLGIIAKTPFWFKVLIYVPLIPPVYYVGLIFFGTILGQFSFFWGMIQARLKFLTGRKDIKH
jgi:hypothetical protein